MRLSPIESVVDISSSLSLRVSRAIFLEASTNEHFNRGHSGAVAIHLGGGDILDDRQ